MMVDGWWGPQWGYCGHFGWLAARRISCVVYVGIVLHVGAVMVAVCWHAVCVIVWHATWGVCGAMLTSKDEQAKALCWFDDRRPSW